MAMETPKSYKIVTYVTITCVASVKKNPKNQSNGNEHQRTPNTHSNYSCVRACCLCENKITKIRFSLITYRC